MADFLYGPDAVKAYPELDKLLERLEAIRPEGDETETKIEKCISYEKRGGVASSFTKYRIYHGYTVGYGNTPEEAYRQLFFEIEKSNALSDARRAWDARNEFWQGHHNRFRKKDDGFYWSADFENNWRGPITDWQTAVRQCRTYVLGLDAVGGACDHQWKTILVPCNPNNGSARETMEYCEVCGVDKRYMA